MRTATDRLFAGQRVIADEAELLLLAVDPAAAAVAGSASALLDEFIDDARGAGRAPAPP